MNDMKRILTMSFAAIFFAFATAQFLTVAVSDDGDMMVVPTFLFGTFALAFVCILLKELIIGTNVYLFENNTLQIKRKKVLVWEINKNDIEDLVVVCDANDGDVHYVTFRYGGKKHVIFNYKKHREGLENFIDGVPAVKKSNLWYYVLELLSW